MHRRIALALLATVALSAAGCAGSAGKSSPAGGVDVFVSVGVSAGGVVGANAQMTIQSVKAAASALNRSGGIDGKKVNVIESNDQGDPTVAVTNLENAINSGNKPLVYITGGPAPVFSAVLPILTQNSILSFNDAPTSTSGEPAKNPYNFDLNEPFSVEGGVLCAYARKQGYHSIAFLYGDDPYFGPDNTATQAACKRDGLTIAGQQSFSDSALNLVPQVDALQATKADAVALLAYGAQAGYALKAEAQLGWTVPTLGEDSVQDSAVIYTAPPSGLLGTKAEANLRYLATNSEVPSSNPPGALAQMMAALKAQGPFPATALNLAWDYDALMLTAAAAKSINSATDAASIAKAIQEGKGDSARTGVWPRYYWTSTSHSNSEPLSQFQMIKPGKLVDGQFQD